MCVFPSTPKQTAPVVYQSSSEPTYRGSGDKRNTGRKSTKLVRREAGVEETPALGKKTALGT